MNLRDLVICYGQTESSPVTTMSITTDPVALRCQTVGRVLPHTHIRIVDPSDPLYPSPHTPSVPIGTPGELWTGGYALQKGYWRNEGETEKSMFFDETGLRWLITGDQGVMDEEGYGEFRFKRVREEVLMSCVVSIVGRIKDIIIRGEYFFFLAPLSDFV
jgi:acyl-CoA synthetase (AMP-forming)/AMP-acid ligase II